MTSIGILNIGMGNLRSVSNAVDQLGFDARLVDGPALLADASHLIIPGVGSFHTAMRRMRERGFVEPIQDFVSSGRPVLGLCLGMQLLASHGEEGDETAGLDLVPGCVARLNGAVAVPHVGWNSMALQRTHQVTRNVRTGVDFYFVHSFHFIPAAAEDVLGSTDYGQPIVAAVARANVIGFQFHPEKSQKNGLQLIDNFCTWDGRC